MDSSSDSEDECLGNIALKLHTVKNKYTKDKNDSTNLLTDSTEAEVDKIVQKALTTKNTTKPTSKSQQGGETSASCNNEDLVDTLVASSSKRVTRSKMAAKRGSVDAGLKSPAKKSAKATKKADKETPTLSKVAAKKRSVDVVKTPAKKSAKAKKKADTDSDYSDGTSVEDLIISQRGRGRGRGIQRNSGGNARMWLPKDPIERARVLKAFYAKQPTQQTSNTSQRGRGRGRGRNRARGRKRNSGKKIKLWLPMDPIERARALSAFYARQ